MSSKYKVVDDQIPHFITFTVIGWVDVFAREQYKEVICESLVYCQKEKALLLHAWVIMSNHIHLIVSTEIGYKIGNVVRDLKKFTAKKIVNMIDQNTRESRRNWMLNMFGYAGRNKSNNEIYQFWQEEYHPVCLDTREKTMQRLTYLHENPVTAGMVWRPNDYKYNSAIDYYEDKIGLLPIRKLQIV